MYAHLIPTLEALGLDASEENVKTLTLAFNRVKAQDCAYKLRTFQADNGHNRYIGVNSQGQSIVFGGEEIPAIGSLIDTGGTTYYVESHLDEQREIAESQTRAQPANAGNKAAR